MIRLSADDKPRVGALAEYLDDHAAVGAVLAGVMPGEAYVDRVDDPRVLLALPPNRARVYLAGDPMSAASDEIQQFLRERYRLTGDNAPEEFLVHFAPESWETMRDQAVGEMLVARARRRSYEFSGDRVKYAPPPAGFVIEAIDEALLGMGYIHTDRMIAEMLSESPSVEYFLRHQGGVCVRRDDTLAGWCMVEYQHDSRCEFGIETLEEYRRMGIATAAASALIERLLRKGVTRIGWHCWADNIGSIGVAERVGFTLIETYPLWYCRGLAISHDAAH